MTQGEIVLAKTIRNPLSKPADGSRARWISLKAKGHFITMVLGHLSPKAPDLTQEDCKRLVGEIGLFSGDDIAECFGEDGFEKLDKFFQEKYKRQSNHPTAYQT
jgi:hypothetical protein